MRLGRDIAALVVSVASIGLIPIYGAPFGGCMESGFNNLELGCSAWPEFSRGVVFIGLLVTIAAHKKVMVTLGLTATLLAVMAGGVGLLATGEEAAYFQDNYLAISQHLSNPLLIGAIAALLLHITILKGFLRDRDYVESA